jgi:hypothetical protein
MFPPIVSLLRVTGMALSVAIPPPNAWGRKLSKLGGSAAWLLEIVVPVIVSELPLAAALL